MNPKIAFLGLGIMGGSMAANLARHGFEVTAWNRTSDRPGVEIAREAGAPMRYLFAFLMFQMSKQYC